MVQTLVSAISPGTELLFYRGQAPTDLPVDETIAALAGRSAFRSSMAMLRLDGWSQWAHRSLQSGKTAWSSAFIRMKVTFWLPWPS